MSQITESPMKKISLEKVVLNMGIGKSGDVIDIAKRALEQISGKKPSTRNAKETQREWGVRKGEPIGVAVTNRGDDAVVLLKRLLEAKGNTVNGKSFDNFGNYSFGINEHIDIPDVKYDPQIGILGLGISITLTRPGYSIRKRSKHKASVGDTCIMQIPDQKILDIIKMEAGCQGLVTRGINAGQIGKIESVQEGTFILPKRVILTLGDKKIEIPADIIMPIGKEEPVIQLK